jgi:glyoxylate reductase
VLVTYRTFNSISITGLFDQEMIDVLPKSLRFICHNGKINSFGELAFSPGQLSTRPSSYRLISLLPETHIRQETNNSTGAGYDQVDVQACTKRGIRVSNTPKAVDDATADINMFLILGALRNFNGGMLALRAGHWRGDPLPPPLGHDPQGKTLGILGMGGIGRNLKSKAEAFGMKVVYHNRKRLDGRLEKCAEYVGFDELLARSDVLSLNLPLNVSTADGVFVVQSGRGRLYRYARLTNRRFFVHAEAY